MPSHDLPQFTIVGSGLAGTLLACYLGKAGYRVDLYERRSDPRSTEQERGRSINLALSVRGIQALREVGLADEVLHNAIPMRGRMMHSPTGALTFQPYGKDDSESINSVSRAGLNLTLVNAASKYDGVRFFFERRCTGIDLATNIIDVLDTRSHQTAQVPCEIVVGADGAYSAVRAQMQKQERFNYLQGYLEYGYKELTIPPGAGGAFQMEKHALHIWPRHSFMMIALPNLDGSFTCTLFWPYEGPNSFAALQSEADIRRFFQQQFPDAVPLMPHLALEYMKNPVGPLLTVHCQPWHLGGRVVLLGDAAHAVVPFLGQGMNAAFEDCTVLSRALAQHSPNWEAGFRSYDGERARNTDALAFMAIENFREMRHHVSSRRFLVKKKWQGLLHKLLGRWYLPLYTMITFTTIPYAAAKRRAQIQDSIVNLTLLGILTLVVVLLVLLFREPS